MTIEQAFVTIFKTIFPAIDIDPITSPVETGLSAVYFVNSRGTEYDLAKQNQMKTANITVYVMSESYQEVAETVWKLIEEVNNYTSTELSIYQVNIIGSSDNYDYDLKIFQSSIEMQFYFN